MRRGQATVIDITPRRVAWRLPLTLAVLAGTAHAASFAPEVSWWADLIALAVLAGVIARAGSARIAALAGFGFGLGWFGNGIFWLYISLHDYGQMAAWLAVLAVALFCAFLALYPALAAWIWWRLRPRLSRTWHAPVFALAWAAGEWLRATLLTGFPWIETGYAQIDGPLSGYAPLFGAHGLSLIAAYVAAALGMALDALVAPAAAAQARRRALRGAALGLVVMIGGGALATVRWTTPAGAPLSVRLVQGNVAQDVKFDPGHLVEQYRLYRELATAAPADLIVLPETALPLPLQESPGRDIDALARFARETRSTIVTGVFIYELDPGAREGRYTNSAVAIGPDAPVAVADHRGLPSYRKRHLVAFGEFIPYGFRWFVDAMTIPIGDQERGPADQAPIVFTRRAGGVARVGVNICYEDYFGDEIALQLQRPDAPDVLANLTNIAWFGNTVAVPQHLLASRLRALETGRPMLRATNTGATAVIGSDGKVAARLAPFTRDVLSAQVQGMQGTTPYVRWRDWPFLLVCWGGLALAWLGTRKA